MITLTGINYEAIPGVCPINQPGILELKLFLISNIRSSYQKLTFLNRFQDDGS